METNEYTADTIWPISSCPGFLHEPRDPELAKLNYRLLFGKPWHSIRDVYGWLNHNSSCKHEVNQWILQKYPIRCSTMTRSPGDTLVGWEAKIGTGIYILFSPKIPSRNEQDLENSDWSVFYINLIWRDRNEYDGENALWAGRRFIQHLEKMPNNPIQAVYLRPTDVCKDIECEHLVEALNLIPTSRASSNRLAKVYSKAIGTVPTKQLDVKGKPYHRVAWWKPEDELINDAPFKWPDLLKNQI